MQLRLSDMVKPLLGLALLIAIIVSVLAIMAPFLTAMIWAVILVSATWGPFQWLSSRLGQRESLAATLIVSALLLFILVPLVLASVEFAQQLTHLARAIPEQVQAGLPDLPNWIGGLPVVGDWAAQQWLALQNQDYQILSHLKGMVGAHGQDHAEHGRCLRWRVTDAVTEYIDGGSLLCRRRNPASLGGGLQSQDSRTGWRESVAYHQ